MEKLQMHIARPDRAPTSTKIAELFPELHHRDPRRRRQPQGGQSTSTCCARNSPTTSSKGRRSATSSTGPASVSRVRRQRANRQDPPSRAARSRVDFDTTQNLFIEGDNLDALKLLQESYLGKVKLIYIDPPYNTGNDFIYDDDFAETRADYLTRSNQRDRRRASGSSPTPKPNGGSTPTG